ncbi:hypothetical protein G6O69_09680 [Pseudenhygromyxa sp. WMMC2535]|uniref:hypothetical protein n=1 Tax=Pseudenhygromyxa sp. WMMC2535 TaxID=2712867 RepID=UPI0015581AD3|nr:hypothetical protein [Pseudenhygromyxa sp. WMMC2535]NVB38101.1 hypothetical protein [Pseudenhygromyxa sp. WMMC2535]
MVLRSVLLRLSAGLALACASACAGDSPADDQADEAGSSSEGAGETQDTGDTGELLPGDLCEDTPFAVEAPGRLGASLRGATSDPAGIASSCGLDGPSIFVRARIPSRVDLHLSVSAEGFEPRLGVLAPGCVAESEDPERLLACAQGLPITVEDLGPDRDLLVVVGARADDPGLASEAPETPELADPLDFELVLEVRTVLAEGERCGATYGRCEDGTVCQLAGDGDGDSDSDSGEEGTGELRCVRPPADSCAAPGELSLPGLGEGPLVVALSPDAVHTDAHEHACAGWRRPERVDRLLLPAGLPDDARLRVRASDARVGLALRGPSCLVEDALACAPASDPEQGAVETLLEWSSPGALATLAEAGERPLLFTELPRPEDFPSAGIILELELL